MPPAYPYICAFLILFLGRDVDAIGSIMIAAQTIGLITVWLWLVRLVRPNSTWSAITLLAVFLWFQLCHFHYSFLFTHDYFLAILGMGAMIRFAPQITKAKTVRAWMFWGLLGGLCSLATPALASAWVLITLLSKGRVRRMLVAFLVAGLVLLPWTGRNIAVFGKFIPVKSNAAYELFQSLQYSENGIVTPDTLAYHPGAIGPEMHTYSELGEGEYISRKSDEALHLLADRPGRYARHCANRACAIALWESVFPMELEWLVPRHFCRFTYPLPFVGLVFVIVSRRWHSDQPIGVATLAALGYALPFVLISFYDRYEYPLGPAKMLFAYYGLLSVFGAGSKNGK
jgi:hypothetical protein